MRCIEPKALPAHSVRVSRRFLSNRLAESLLEKAYTSLVPPEKPQRKNQESMKPGGIIGGIGT